MGFDKKFQKQPAGAVPYRAYFDFLRSLDIEFDDEVLISKIMQRKKVEYLEKGELYLGIRKTPSSERGRKQIILYVNPIEWSPTQATPSSIGILRYDRQKFLEWVESGTYNASGASFRSVNNERGCLKEYAGLRNQSSYYLKTFDIYPISVQVGIINWLW